MTNPRDQLVDHRMIRDARLLVLKIGATSVVDGKNRVRTQVLAELVAEVVKFARRGGRVVLVSSGAAALGAGRLRISRPSSTDLAGQRACSMAGQAILMSTYEALAGALGWTPVFSVLTARDFREDTVEEVREGLIAALAMERVLPVISHNDATCLDARCADNDHLAVDVAIALDADMVILGADSTSHHQDPYHAALRAQERNVVAVITDSTHLADVLRGQAECTWFPAVEETLPATPDPW